MKENHFYEYLIISHIIIHSGHGTGTERAAMDGRMMMLLPSADDDEVTATIK